MNSGCNYCVHYKAASEKKKRIHVEDIHVVCFRENVTLLFFQVTEY